MRRSKSVIPEKVFVDADAFVAVANKNDPHHDRALRFAKLLAQHRTIKYTSNFVFGEVVTVVSQQIGLEPAVSTGRDIQDSEMTIIDVTAEQREMALEKFSTQRSKNSRFTDMVNMVLMDELKIDTIFSFDNHYPKNGYKLLAPVKR